jgi:Holliday junction resolvase-like predicted endonuclease
MIMSPIYIWANHRFVFEKHPMAGLGIDVIFCLVFLWNLRLLAARTFGQSVEKKALKKLVSYLGGDIVQTNVQLPNGGDADALIRSANITANIEIKSVNQISRIKRVHTEQALKAGRQLHSIPVIWLPQGEEERGGEVSGVRVYSGGVRGLCRFLGV